MDPRAALIYLLRHGEVVQAETRRFIGHLDVPLSPRGESQSQTQAARLRGVPLTAVYTSDLIRARATGTIIGAPHGLVPTVVPALREMDMGRWDGLTAAEIAEREPEAFKEWMSRIGEFPFPAGESVGDLIARVWPAFAAIAAEHRDCEIAIVAHGGTNRAILCRALDVPFPRLLAFGQDYCALTILEATDGAWRLRVLNESPGLYAASHLHDQ